MNDKKERGKIKRGLRCSSYNPSRKNRNSKPVSQMPCDEVFLASEYTSRFLIGHCHTSEKDAHASEKDAHTSEKDAHTSEKDALSNIGKRHTHIGKRDAQILFSRKNNT